MRFIYLPFSYIMKFCVWIAQNSYLFGLFFFALVFQLLLQFPLAIKQQKSQIARAKIQPKELAIRERYAGRTDRVTQQKMQTEIQEMYQKEGFSPFSGCLPMLIQLPLIFILFAIVRYPVQYSSSFTDEAVDQMTAVVQEADPSFAQDEEDLAALFSQYAYTYAEDIRSHLTADNETAGEVEKMFAECIATLGERTTPGEDEEQTYENGYQRYLLTPSDRMTYRELNAVDIVETYGDDYVASLKEAGALPADYESKRVDISGMLPDFTFLGINLLRNPSFSGNKTWRDWMLLLIPLLVFLSSFLSTKLTRRYQPEQVGPDGKEVGSGLFMTVGMPLISTFFSLSFPAAIGAYWVWRTLLSMVQVPIVQKLYPIPVYTPEQLEEMKKEYRGKQKKKKVITIEVDEDDDSYRDLEVSPPGRVESARPKQDGKKKQGGQEDLPYRRPTKIEMLSADDDESEKDGNSGQKPDST